MVGRKKITGGRWGDWGGSAGPTQSRLVHFSSWLYFSAFPLSESLEQAKASQNKKILTSTQNHQLLTKEQLLGAGTQSLNA